jgi:glyoxylase-like metal-dependent hydrolase (beta-lactamase superfamily II)
MSHFLCVTCGTQFAASPSPPASCPICSDDRQYVGWGGQSWTTLEALRQDHRLRFEAEGEGVTGIAVEPHFAIGQRALLVQTPQGNVLWDCVGLVDADAVARIRDLGGLEAIAISHPHYYTVMAEWSEAFGGVPIYLHEEDRQWVMRPDEAIVHWTGDTHALAPGLTLIRSGGHFPGATVLHSQESAGGRGALFAGDVIAVNMDRASVSFMHSFPNYIPLDAKAVRRIASLLAPYRFETIYGAFANRNVATQGRAAFDRSVARYLAAIGAA